MSERRSRRLELQRWLMLDHFKSSRELEVLDLGAEHGHTGRAVRDAFPNARVTGVEIHEPTLASCRALNGGAYCELLLEEATAFLRRGRRFDVIVTAEIVEHMPRAEGLCMMDLAADLCQLLVVTTPLVFDPRGEIDGNPYQRHVSWWTEADMRAAGLQTFALLPTIDLGVYFRARTARSEGVTARS